jgi:hypothetical protein
MEIEIQRLSDSVEFLKTKRDDLMDEKVTVESKKDDLMKDI